MADTQALFPILQPANASPRAALRYVETAPVNDAIPLKSSPVRQSMQNIRRLAKLDLQKIS